MSEIKKDQKARRKRRFSPERIAGQVRETAASYNAALARAKNEGVEVITEEDKYPEIIIKEIRINKAI